MKVLITGVAGFIGSSLAEKLVKQYQVFGIDKPSYEYALGNIKNIPSEVLYSECDIRNTDKIEKIINDNGIKVVYHLAAISDTRVKDKDAFEEVNFKASKDLMNVCIKNEIPFVYASSASIYGNGETPSNLYALSKLKFDNFVLENNPPLVCGLRFFNVFGLNEEYKGASASLPFQILNRIKIKNLVDGDTINLFEGNPQRDFIYINDVITNITTLTGQTGIFDVGTGNPEPFENIVYNINKHSNYNFKINLIKNSIEASEYQHYTKAKNPIKALYSLESGIKDLILKIKKVEPNKIKKILLFGDLIIDGYHLGSSNRLSPEAPIPVVSLNKQTPEYKLGGAGNVLINLLALGAEVHYVGSYNHQSDDMAHLMQLFQNNESFDNLKFHNVLSDNLISKKIRVVSNGQQIVRMDYDQQTKYTPEEAKCIFGNVNELINTEDFDIAVMSDYDKGQLSYSVPGMIHMLKDNGIKTLIDPKTKDLTKYRGSYIIKPNLREAQEALGQQYFINLPEFLQNADVENMLVTLSEDGMMLHRASEKPFHIQADAQEVFDVVGAGDTVMATIAYCLANGYSLEDSIIRSNVAAGIAIKHHGVYTLQPKDINKVLMKY